MKLPEPFRADGEHIAIDLLGGRALFTTRRGGVSEGPFHSLNLGRTARTDGDGAEDDAPDRVARNREILAARVGLPWQRFAYGRQVHGTNVARAGREASAPSAHTDAHADADGQLTSEPGVAAIVMVADCLPVALACAGGVAMVHAGWRGLAGGILGEGVRALREIDDRVALSAAIGPGAGGCCYRVGDEVHAAFADIPDAHRGRNLDLALVARAHLHREGVEQVHDVGLCTMCSEPELFFSHRRDGGVTGRQAGVAWRT